MKSTIFARGLAARLLLVGTITTSLVAVGSTCWAVASLNNVKSNVNKAGTGNGPAVSGFGSMAGVTLSGPSDTQTVYTVPADPAVFILTDFCSSSATGGVELDVTGFGFVAQTSPDLCYRFAGLQIPGGASGRTITCSTGSTASPGSYSCMISGVLTVK